MDSKLFQSINRLSCRSSLMDQLMIFISNRIRYVYLFIILAMLFKKQTGKKITMEVVISLIVCLFLNRLIKLFFFRPRPFMKRRVGILIPSKMDSSFPSKHTLLVFAVSTTVFLYRRVLGSIMWGISLLTGLSRIWVGHHYPTDIIGSAILGSLSSLFVHKRSLEEFVTRND